jgi:hypothetical protein
VFLVLHEGPDQGAHKERGDFAPEREQARERSRARFAAAWVTAARQKELARKREQTRKKKQADEAAAWRRFVQTEQRQLQLRKEGQLARLLGQPLPGEIPELLQRLAAEDQRQAEHGLVALMSGGKTSYKRLDDLEPEDMPARIAANDLAQGTTGWVAWRKGSPILKPLVKSQVSQLVSISALQHVSFLSLLIG